MIEKDDLFEWIEQNIFVNGRLNSGKLRLSFLKKSFPAKLEELMSRTAFLDESHSISERVYCVFNGIDRIPKCLTCDLDVNYQTFTIGYAKHCSRGCMLRSVPFKEEAKKVCLERYGVENPMASSTILQKKNETCERRHGNKNVLLCDKIMNKVRATSMARYGVDHPLKRKDVREKSEIVRKETCLKKYGFESSACHPDVIKKRNATLQLKYGDGITNAFQAREVREKIVKTCLERYGVKYSSQKNIDSESERKVNNREWMIENYVNQRKNSRQIATELGISETMVYVCLRKHGIKTRRTDNVSSFEKEIVDHVKTLTDLDVVKNTRKIIGPKELDIFVPAINFAIEFDGIYWHSGESRSNYHLMKTAMCRERSIDLFHVFQNEWVDPVKQGVWRSMIANKFGKNERVYARKCVVREVGSRVAHEFLLENHLQGFVSSFVKIGLFHENELVSLMTFGKARFNKNYEWELTRFCSKKFVNVVGGVSKLFAHFVRNCNPQSIISYADLRYSNGKMYEKIGMRHVGNSRPNYYYFELGKIDLHNRIEFQKHKLSRILENFDESKSEHENMIANGYRRIWDCGNMVFEWRKEDDDGHDKVQS